MRHQNYSRMIRIIAGILLSCTSLHGQIDWAQRVVESTMQRDAVKTWSYHAGFYSFGQYRIWKVLGNDAYFQYIQNNIDNHIDQNGNIDTAINSLDDSQPGLVTLLCFNETGEAKYKTAIDFIRDIYDTYPRTSDGGFWHGANMQGQLWLDGVYMILPFLVYYGEAFGDTALFTEAANQICTYASHLKDESGLLYHAYDEDGSSSWADPVTLHSPHFWGRSMGWFGMAIIEILEKIPEDHPGRPELIQILSDLVEGLSNVQDEATGLWYQVVDKGDSTGNWLESSCSCMYSYFTARAVDKGYIDSTYLAMATRAYEGILRHKVYIGSDNLFNLIDISEGTGVSADYSYYINRSRNTNDLHGLGAFLMMCWQMAQIGTDLNENSPPVVHITHPDDSSFFAPNSNVLIDVRSYDLDGSVIQVEFYEGNTLLHTDTQSPWNFTWTNVSEGDYVLTAVAMDDSNATTISSPIHISVTNDSIIYEAEEGIISSGSVDQDHAGYTGTGFVNLTNEAGSHLEMTLPIPQNGTHELSIRYANGSSNHRPCEIRFDDAVLYEAFDFPPTAGWSDWAYSEVLSLDVTAGAYPLRIIGLTSESAPNIDHVKLVYQVPDRIDQDQFRDSSLGFALDQNYPNPFNPSTRIDYHVSKTCRVRLTVCNVKGQIVKEPVNTCQRPGAYSVNVNLRDFPSGIYFYKISAGDFQDVRKMIKIE